MNKDKRPATGAIYIICLSLLLFSCINKDSEAVQMGQLKQRISILEQRIDSLINRRKANSNGLNNSNNSNLSPSSYSTFRESGRCLAITKKGTQCKRKAKNNSYCWQHGG
jgi:hypothetical protein